MIHPQFIRNLGILSKEEIDKLGNSAVAVAGCGCIGGFSAELLARMGIGKLMLADPDEFDLSNINRQCAATHLTAGRRKVDALKEHLLAINPSLQIVCFDEGVNENNALEFIADADYVIDAIDYFALPDSVSLHRAARRRQLHITTAVALGFGTTVLTFAPDGVKLEDILGITEARPADTLQGMMVPASSYTGQLPAYATPEKVQMWLDSRTIPAISVGQALGPGILVSQLVLHLLGRKLPKVVPDSFQLHLE